MPAAFPPSPAADSRILTVPGLNGSGHRHWQTIWERTRDDCSRVEQADWEHPDPLDWAFEINRAVTEADRPVVLVAHSLGCLAVAHWAAIFGEPYARLVTGALLVAPCDPEARGAPPAIRAFEPDPWTDLPFWSMVVASTDDPYTTIDRAHAFADRWGSLFVNIGEAGHINADSGLGAWRLGQALVCELVIAARQQSSTVPLAVSSPQVPAAFRLGR